MKKFLVLILFFCLSSAESTAETSSDSSLTDSSSIKPDSVSTFGHYLSLGIGWSKDYGIREPGLLFSYSLAYKNHLFTYTHAAATPISFYNAPNLYYYSNYSAILVGESFRTEHSLLSLSAGIAYTNIDLVYTTMKGDLSWINPAYITSYRHSGFISFPVECKAFVLAHNIVGIGIHVSYDFVPDLRFSPYYVGFCLVVGQWNKPHYSIQPRAKKSPGIKQASPPMKEN
jgi:hypothetical protein